MRQKPNCQTQAKRKSRRGAFTVEFAVCCSVYFMIVFAGLEFTRYFFARHAVDQAAYEACRVAIVPGNSPGDVRTMAERMLSAAGMRAETAQITITPASFDNSTENVTVAVVCPFSDNSWMPSRFFQGASLQSAVTLDHENRAFLIPSEATGDIGNNDNEPIDI